MKTLMKALMFGSFILFAAVSCEEEEEKTECGCESETRTTIPESTNLVGEMFYLKPTASEDNYYTNLF